MVQPCDKYQGLVVGPDGQTVADPYGFVPTLADYEEWRSVALNLIERAEAELQRNFELHGALMPEDAAPVESLRVRYDALGSTIDQAFSFDDITWGPAIVQMVELARDAACQIGVVEQRIIDDGGDPNDIPAVPKPGASGKSSSKGTGKGMGLGLVLLAVAWWASRD